jgi:cobalt-zinc-cadmium efflux system outer membrane protein
MRSWLLCATLAAVVLPRAVCAQSLPLTEAEALQRLSADSPRVRAIRAGADVARADVLAAGRLPNPRVTLDRESAAGVTEYMTMVGQTLPITGVRRLQMRAASSLVDASTARAEDEIRRARADLRLAFAQLVAAQSRERELTAARDRLRGLVEREAAGDTAGFDRLRGEREVAELDADLSMAAADRARAQAMLAGFFGESVEPSRLVATAEHPAAGSLPPVDALVQRAESTRGEFVALRKEIESARWSIQAADRRLVPEPEVVAGTKSTSTPGGTLGGVLTVHAVLSLFDRGRPEKALAAARVSQAESRGASLRLALRAEIAGLHAAVTERRAAAARYRTALTDGSGQIERIAQVSYEAGERGILELLDAYRTGASARVRQAMLDAAVREAEIELEFVSGWEIK